MTERPDPDVAPVELAARRLQSPSARRSRLLGFAIGVILLGAALFALWRQQGAMSSAWTNLTGAPLELILLALFLPAISLIATSSTFWLLTCRYGTVGFREMLALLASAWLLNYLPLWPGMIGRLAYHKSVNRIPVADSAKALIWANVLNILAALVFLASSFLGVTLLEPTSPWIIVFTSGPVGALGLFAMYAYAKKPEADPHVWRTLAALSVRLLEHHLWAARFAVCFALVGAPIAWGPACLIASITALAIAIPITGNSLGVREWAVGAAAWLLPTTLLATAALDLQVGLAADLVNRAMELALAIPLGLASAAWLARRAKRLGATTSTESSR